MRLSEVISSSSSPHSYKVIGACLEETPSAQAGGRILYSVIKSRLEEASSEDASIGQYHLQRPNTFPILPGECCPAIQKARCHVVW